MNNNNTAQNQNSEKGLLVQSQRVHKQLHITGMVIGGIMLAITLLLVIGIIYMTTELYQDVLYRRLDYVTMSDLNSFISWIVLAPITFLTAKIFFAMYKDESPFSRKNITRIKIIAALLMVLSFAPITIEMMIGHYIGLDIKFTMNFMYIFIGVILYCLSFVFEHGHIIQLKSDEIIDVQEQVILAFAEIIEAKSGQTGQHVKRVSEYCRILGEGLGLSSSEVENLRLASMMHDVGKLLIPNEILEKESSLSKEEFEIIKTHVTIGEQLLHNAAGEIMEEARKVALEHHEKWDGTGYLGKKEEEISLAARIVSVADVFDSLVSARSYKTGWEPNKVYSVIVEDSGRKFDPQVVQVFVRNYSKMLEVYNKFSQTTSKNSSISIPVVPNRKDAQQVPQVSTNMNEESAIDTDIDLDLRHLI